MSTILPFMADPDGPLPPDINTATRVYGLTVSGYGVRTATSGSSGVPVVMFRFTDADGRFLPPVLLMLDDEMAAALEDILPRTVAGARRVAGGLS